MLDNHQIEALQAPLNKANVKKNPKGFDYVEGWHVIAEANRIFGFDGWDRETIEMKMLGEPEQDAKQLWRVAYHCRVRITVKTDGREIIRDGSGYGSGIVRDLRDAHESAIKEAETDAMKRALMTFGNPFGLALYDKKQEHVIDESRPARSAAPQKQSIMPEDFTARVEYMVECRDAIAAFTDSKELVDWWMSDAQKALRRHHQLDDSQVQGLKQAVMNKRVELENRKAA
jgi:DNA recombination protein Rad52